MASNERPTKERVARNELEKCEARGCSRRRKWTLQYCPLHIKRLAYNGSPNAFHLQKKEIHPYVLEVRAILRSNPDHAGLREAEDRMLAILEPGAEPWSRNRQGPQAARRHLWEELTRLRRAGITPRQALEVALAVWLLAMEQDARFPNRQVILHAIANAVFRIAPLRVTTSYWHKGQQHKQVRRPAAGPVRLLGSRIMDNLFPFASQVRLAAQASKQAQLDATANLRLPLRPATGKRRTTSPKLVEDSPASPPPPRPQVHLGPPRKKPIEDIPSISEDDIS